MAGIGSSGQRRRLVLVSVVALLASVFITFTPAPASALPVGTATVMARGIAEPTDITTGPDGNLWFTDTGADAIGRITPAGVVTVFGGEGISAPSQIVAGPDGNLWFTNTYSDSIGQITTAGVVTNFTDPTISYPQGIAVGSDGNLWFTNLDSIGQITTAGVVANFTDPTIDAPSAITSGPGDNLWFTNTGDNSIGQITPAGVVDNFTDPSIAYPSGIAEGADGNVWFTNQSSGTIGRITPAGAVDSFSDPSISYPTGITAGPSGNLWFANSGSTSVGLITTSGVITDFPGSANHPNGITADANDQVWFANTAGNSIGRITTTGTVATFSGNGISHPQGIATGSDGNLWFTNSDNNSVGRITPAGAVSNFTVDASPGAIAAGSDGNLWFTDPGEGKVGRITTAGVSTMFADPASLDSTGIAAGSDGALWFTDTIVGQIGRITTAGDITTFTSVSPISPQQIASGSDGSLWFTDAASHAIGRITTAGVYSSFTTAGMVAPGVITAGLPGNLWFSDPGSNSIGRITTAGVITRFTAPSISSPWAIASGSDGNVWFANNGDQSIGRITPTGSVTNFPQTVTRYVTGMINGPDGNQWVTSGGNSSIVRVSVATAPSVPTGVVAVRGNTQVTVSWTAPASTGGAPITGYTVTGSPGGQFCSWVSGPLSCTVTGLTNGQPYTFTVTATSSAGTSPPSSPSASVTPATTPTAPTAVTATAGDGQVAVAWTAPSSNGGSPIDSYTATASPGGQQCTRTTGPLTCSVTGLTNGTSYTFTVTAHNGVGTGPASAASPLVTPLPPGALFHALDPARIIDTRPPPLRVGPSGPWVGAVGREVQVGGVGGVPSSATAVVLNVTVTGGSANGDYLTIWPTGTPRPTASSINFNSDQTIANQVTVKLGTGGSAAGKVSIYNAGGTVDVILDVNGYYDGTPGGDGFTSLPPVRIIDSRPPPSRVGPLSPWVGSVSQDVQVTGGLSGIPADADAVVLNVTATGGTANGDYLTIWPAGTVRPTVSSLNVGIGQTIPNAVTVKLGTGSNAGKISIFNAGGTQNVIVDVAGYFKAGTGKAFYPEPPARIIDSRPTPLRVGPLGPWNGSVTQDVAATGGISGVPLTADSVVLNVTSTGGTVDGDYFSIWPSGQTQPTVSSLNFNAGETIANAVTVKLGTAPNAGKISVYNAGGVVNAIIDVAGFYA